MQPTPDQTLALRQLKWLIKSGLRQETIAARLGTKQPHVSRYLRNADRLTPAICLLIGYVFRERCQELGMDPAAVDLDAAPDADALAA